MSASAAKGERLKGLAHGGALNIVGALCQQGAMFFLTALIARRLGSADLGRFALMYALLSVLGILTLCGFRAALTRFIAVQLSDGDDGAVRGTIRLCVGASVGASVAIGVALFAAAGPVSQFFFHDHSLVLGVQCVALALPAATVRDAALAASQGWRTQRAFTLIGWVYEPLVRLALTAVLIALGLGLTGAFAALVFGAWTAAAAAVWALRRRTATLALAPLRTATSSIISFSMVSWATTIASTGLIWADTLLLGHFRSSADVGVYTVATRLVTLAVFVMAPINAAFAPQFAHHFHRGERDDMARIYTAATGWIVRLSLPAFALLLIFPEDLLALFGGEFKTGAAVTITLAIGQLVNAFTGPCGTALNMAGHVTVNLVNNVVTLAFNVGLNLWLIPEYGAIGAALAWTLSLGAVNLARLVEVYLIMGLVPFDLGTLKALASFVVASLVALGIRAWVPPGYQALVVGGIALAGAYLVTTLLLGLQPEERDVVAAFRGRTTRSA